MCVRREARTIKKERIRALVEADPVFRRDDQYFNDRETTYMRGLQKINRIQQRRRELKMDDEEQRLFKNYVGDTLPVRWPSTCPCHPLPIARVAHARATPRIRCPRIRRSSHTPPKRPPPSACVAQVPATQRICRPRARHH